jgi:phosphoribosylanthranilate isomerase
MAVWIKICGVTSVEDARMVVAAGADAVGVNLIPSSKRAVDIATARALREAVGTSAEVVAIVADFGVSRLLELRERTGIQWLQLHGAEEHEELAALLPAAYKAVRIGSAADVTDARRFAGVRLLADAKVDGALGGTGHSFDWSLVGALARERPLLLAGGLRPDNVARAVESVRPFGVDTASGVENADPRRKDPEKTQAFVRAARAAALLAGGMLTLGALGCAQSFEGGDVIAPDTPIAGAVVAAFRARSCKDATGADVPPRDARFLVLTPSPKGSTASASSLHSPPSLANVRLLQQRAGYESVLITRQDLEPSRVVFRTLVTPPLGDSLLQEVRLPRTLSGQGELLVADEWGSVPAFGGDSQPSDRNVVLRCELVADSAPRPNAEL